MLVGSRGVGEEEVLGSLSHGRRTRSGRQFSLLIVTYTTGLSGHMVSPQQRGRAPLRSSVD